MGDRHRRISDAVWHIPGWLTEEDALKLYELAYLADGPILEIGAYCGRSTVVVATAVADRGAQVPIVSLDTDSLTFAIAQRSAKVHAVDELVLFVCGSADRFFRAVPEYGPRLVFVDSDHSKEGVTADLKALEKHVTAGALILFHDYLPMMLPDTTGFPMSAEPIEVAETVENSWLVDRAEFSGTFGASALFRLTS